MWAARRCSAIVQRVASQRLTATLVATTLVAVTVPASGLTGAEAQDPGAPSLYAYGPQRQTAPRDRYVVLGVRCPADPCDVALTARAYARTAGGRRLPALDIPLRSAPVIELQNVGSSRTVTYLTAARLPSRKLLSPLTRYRTVALRVQGAIVDAQGRSATKTRTVTLVSKRRPKKPKPKRTRPKPLSETQRAERAVKARAEARYADDDLIVTGVSCRRYTASYWNCDFEGLDRVDVSQGIVEGHEGTATVTRYGTKYDVTITSYGPG